MRASLLLRTAVAALALAAARPAFADGVLPAQASAVQREQAQARFLRAKDLLAKAQYAGALDEFRASHDIVASPNTRLEIARCLQAMGRLVDAYAELGRTAVEAKELRTEDNRYDRALDAATAERAELQPKLGFVALALQNAADGTRVVVGGEELRRAAWGEPAPVLAGATEIVVSTPGHADVTRDLDVPAGTTASITLDAASGATGGAAPDAIASDHAAPARAGPPLRTYAYVAGGVGLAGFATLAIFGALAHSSYDDLQAACGGAPCPASKSGEISSGRTQESVANVGLVVGLVGVAAGATLFVLSLRHAQAGPSAALVVGPAWAGVRGTL